MGKRSSKVIEGVNKTTITVIFGIGFFVSQTIILSILMKLNLKDVFILQTTFDNSTFESIINNWKSSGIIDYYFKHYYFDFIHPVFYGLFLSSLVSKLLGKGVIREKYSFIIYFPFVAGLFDIIENTLHLSMITHNSYTTYLVMFSALVSSLKWLLAFFCLLISLAFIRKLSGKQYKWIGKH